MSKVFSFRLREDNHREARALKLLDEWIEQGYTLRFIITEALLKLDHPGSNLKTDQDDRPLDIVLEQIKLLIESAVTDGHKPIIKQKPDTEAHSLSEKFLTSVRLASKPGINSPTN